MIETELKTRINVDSANPGQFYACCGLLELAHRLWNGAEGWFERDEFCLDAITPSRSATSTDLLVSLAKCELTNTMTPGQVARLDMLSKLSGKERAKTAGQDDEKKELEKLRREEPIVLPAPFNLRLDWFRDDRAGGNRFKTWAGQQSVLDIASSMKEAMQGVGCDEAAAHDCLRYSTSGCGLPFNFDSDLGGQGSAIDVGFSFDPLAGSALTRIESTARPCLELLAFIGLQRFRPRPVNNENRYLYCAWDRPLAPAIAAAAACGAMPPGSSPRFEFRLLYRTKYLKSFLPAQPFTGESNE